MARHILFLVYETGYLKRYYRQAGFGWLLYWWLPKNWIPNLIHLIKNKEKSIPVRDFIEWWNKPSGYVKDVVFDYEFFVGRKQVNYTDDSEMPF